MKGSWFGLWGWLACYWGSFYVVKSEYVAGKENDKLSGQIINMERFLEYKDLGVVNISNDLN